MYYTIAIGIEQETMDSQGNPKVKKAKMLVEAESAEEAILVINNYINEDMRTIEVLGLAKTPFEEILTSEGTPKYYKAKATT
jgi:hypothetical protein